MALPSSGPISSADIAAEMGVSTVTIPDANTRLLTGIASGPIVLPDDFWGKSMPSLTEVDNRTTAATNFSSVNFGATDATRWIIVLAMHGDTGFDPGAPTCTIGGGAATRSAFSYAWDGGGNAIGAAMFVAQPSGTSGTVAVSWNGLNTNIVVLRAVGFNCATAHDADSVNFYSPTPLSVDVPNNGLLVALGTNRANAVASWAGATLRENVGTTLGFRGYATEINLAAQSGRGVSYTSISGLYAGICATFGRA
jgi:hypothetical protein